MRKALPIILTSVGSALLVFAVMDRDVRQASRGVDFMGNPFSRGATWSYSTGAKAMGSIGAGMIVAGVILLRRP